MQYNIYNVVDNRTVESVYDSISKVTPEKYAQQKIFNSNLRAGCVLKCPFVVTISLIKLSVAMH